MLTLTKDSLMALGRELADLAIAEFQQARADHASTVGVPAPTAHPLIERIVREHGGRYVVRDATPDNPARDFGAELDALKAALVGKAVLSEADVTAGISSTEPD